MNRILSGNIIALSGKRLKNKEDLYRREVVMGLMQGFFFELCNIFNSHAPTAAATVKNKSRKEYIFERFYESLIESYQSERSVKFYADQLCLTPKHLSGVVKEVSGKTVGEWIDEPGDSGGKSASEFFEYEYTRDCRPAQFLQTSLSSGNILSIIPVCLLKNTAKADNGIFCYHICFVFIVRCFYYKTPERTRLSVSGVISR